MNPVRAQMVVRPEQYRWSSYRAHTLDTRDDWLATHPLFEALGRDRDQRKAAYRAICALPLGSDAIARQQLKD